MTDAFAPRANKDKTTQACGTPREFLNAVESRWDVKLGFDIHCTSVDCVTFTVERTKVTAQCIPDINGAHYVERRSLHGYFYDKGVDAMQQDWTTIEQTYSWDNPPFHHMAPIAQKSRDLAVARREQILQIEAGELPSDTRLMTHLFSLYPAALGSDWFRKYVEPYARTYVVGPRIGFVDPVTGLPFKLPLMDPKTGLQKVYKKGERTGEPIFTDGAINRDCALIDWGGEPGIQTWLWKQPKTRAQKAKKQSMVVE